MTNWKEHGWPFKDFNEEITQTWIDNGLTWQKAKEWLEANGIKHHESDFILWLKNKKIETFNLKKI